MSQQICCLERGIFGTKFLTETTVQKIKNLPDDEISPEDKKMFDLIQKGVVKRIFWDCVANEAAEEDYGEEDAEEQEEDGPKEEDKQEQANEELKEIQAQNKDEEDQIEDLGENIAEGQNEGKDEEQAEE